MTVTMAIRPPDHDLPSHAPAVQRRLLCRFDDHRPFAYRAATTSSDAATMCTGLTSRTANSCRHVPGAYLPTNATTSSTTPTPTNRSTTNPSDVKARLQRDLDA